LSEADLEIDPEILRQKRQEYIRNKQKIKSLLQQNQYIKKFFYDLGKCINCGGNLSEEKTNSFAPYTAYKVCQSCFQIKTPLVGFHPSEFDQVEAEELNQSELENVIRQED